MEKTTQKPANFATLSGALMRKNIIVQKRNVLANLVLILSPVLLCSILVVMTRNLDKASGFLQSQTEMAMSQNPPMHQVLFRLPKPGYRATSESNTSAPNDFPDLPLSTCKAEGTCPVSILVTGMNRTLAYRLVQNLFWSGTLGSLDTHTMRSKFVLGRYASTSLDDPSLYIVQPKCEKDSTFHLSTEENIVTIQEDVKCVEGLSLWREKSTNIVRELSAGYQKGNSENKIDEFLTAYDFLNTNGSIFNATVWYNGTSEQAGSMLRATNLASNSYIESIRGAHVQILFEFVKDMPTAAVRQGSFIMLDFYTITFSWIIQSLLPIILHSLVYEKQNNLRMIMKMHGLGDLPYWIVNYGYYLLVSSAYMLSTVIFGSIFGLQIFRLNDYSVQFVFFFLYINLQIAFAFVTTTLFSDARTVSVVGRIYVFASGIAGDFLFHDKKSIPRKVQQVLQIVPCFALSSGLHEFSRYSNEAFSLGDIQSNWRTILVDKEGILFSLFIMIAECPVLFLVAYYFDQVGSNGTGVRKHPLWFLSCFYRSPNRSEQKQGCDILVNVEKADILQEREKVERLIGDSSQNHMMICHDLKKTYPPRDGNPVKHAVQGLSLALPQGECFGLLGPNGAGKTSFISMMTGLTTPTSGTAFISGLDIRKDMDNVYSLMGVCPQHDLIWDVLTGTEHLLFYGRLKNLRGLELMQAVEESLRSVNLTDKGDTRVGQYSGGMKRRLSVAISLIGNPKVVYLDEPSTGLDPASRKALWRAVQCAKKDKAIILTTHSMEEAEFLCDRVGIFVDGSLQCIGNPKQLRATHGGYFLLTITALPSQEVDVENLVHLLSPSSTKVYQLSGTQKFHVPKQGVQIADIFREIENAKTRIEIQNWGLADATLEDVFMKVAKDALSIS